jgi:hypothetical protein
MSEHEERIIPKQYQERELYSFSRLGSFKNCEYEYWLNYIKKLSKLQNIYGFIGGSVHDLTQSMQRKEIDNNQALELFNQELLKAELQGFKFPSDKVKQNFTECILHFLKNYKVVDAEKFEIEKEIYCSIGKLDTVILGYLDILYHFKDGVIEIQDYKSSTMFSAKDLPEKSRQLVLYAYALAKDYGIKVNSIKFNMLKYATIIWQGKTKKRSVNYQRNQICLKLKNEFKKDLLAMNKPEMEVNFIIAQAIESNKIPDILKDKYQISDCLIEVPLTDESITELENYIDDTVTKIMSKDVNNEGDWQPTDLNKNSFYCSTLCSQRKSCKYYKQYIEKNIDDFEPKQPDTLFTKLFGNGK